MSKDLLLKILEDVETVEKLLDHVLIKFNAEVPHDKWPLNFIFDCLVEAKNDLNSIKLEGNETTRISDPESF